MLSKEELLAKDIPELEAIAQSVGAEFSKDDDKDTLVYAILDKDAENEERLIRSDRKGTEQESAAPTPTTSTRSTARMVRT